MKRKIYENHRNAEPIALAFSGGIDSAIAAVILANAGYAVHAVNFNFWKWKDIGDQNSEIARAIEDLKRVIKVEFSIIDAEDIMRESVIDNFILQLGEGKTPSPCVRCNPLVKFKLLRKYADDNGITKIATGHYAQVHETATGLFLLQRAVDLSKDQSYMLCYLKQETLKRLVLPLGHSTKKEIREFAIQLGLEVSTKPESQDLCFLNQNSYHDFVKHFAPGILIPGDIVDQAGNVLGSHEGLALYTIGQRKGIRIAAKEAYYVISKDITNNRLIVGFKSELGRDMMLVSNVNWISGIQIEKCECDVKIRYLSRMYKGVLQRSNEKGEYIVKFTEKLRDITPGQFAVFYKSEKVLGGGIIQKAM